jgi:glutaconate CoA-transferase subunit B
MPKSEAYTAGELLSILSARQLKDGQVVFAGVGIPLLAATLAQRLRCPGLTMLGSAEVLLLLQRGYVDVGFMGAAQIDQYGNLNSSFIGDPKHPKTRLPGTGGGNDISSLTEMIVAIKHEKRRFVENVDFVTSPGWLRGEDTRRQSGLPNGGMYRVITDLAVFGFDEKTRRMKPIALNPGVTREQVQDNTGFKLEFDHDTGVTEPPTDHELMVLRELDPERLYIT